MRTTLFFAALLTVTCDSPAPQTRLPPPDASAALPPDNYVTDGSCGVVDLATLADLAPVVDLTVDDGGEAVDDGGEVVDLAPVADLATRHCPPTSRYSCGRTCCVSPCCTLAPCPPLSICPDGSYNTELSVVLVAVCC